MCLLAYAMLPQASTAISWAAWILTAALGQISGPLYGRWGGSPLEPFNYIPGRGR